MAVKPLGATVLESSTRPCVFDFTAASGATTNPMAGWGFWASAGGQLGITDVSMSSFGPMNYRMPTGVATPNGSAEETLRLCAFGSQHVGGAQFAMADGSTRFVSENLDRNVARAVGTRAGAEAVGEF